jgi:hypothetical protein
MSDYLLSIARRSAGLAPVVRARPPALGPVVVAANVTPARPADAAGSPAMARAIPGPKPTLRDVVPAVTIRAEPETRTPVTRLDPRPVGDGPIAPALSSASAAIPPGRAVPAASTRAPDAMPSSRADRPATRSGSGDLHGQPPTRAAALSPRERVSTDAPPTTRVPQPTPDVPVRPAVLPASTDRSATPATVAETVVPAASMRPVPPRLADQARPSGPPGDPVRHVPLDRPAIATPAAAVRPDAIEVLEAQSVRHVEVRIGTIEILGPTPAPVPPTPSPASPVEAYSPGGFDAFVRLRTYAPWGR